MEIVHYTRARPSTRAVRHSTSQQLLPRRHGAPDRSVVPIPTRVLVCSASLVVHPKKPPFSFFRRSVCRLRVRQECFFRIVCESWQTHPSSLAIPVRPAPPSHQISVRPPCITNAPVTSWPERREGSRTGNTRRTWPYPLGCDTDICSFAALLPGKDRRTCFWIFCTQLADGAGKCDRGWRTFQTFLWLRCPTGLSRVLVATRRTWLCVVCCC